MVYKHNRAIVGEVAQQAVESFEFIGRGAVDTHKCYVGLRGTVAVGVVEGLEGLPSKKIG